MTIVVHMHYIATNFLLLNTRQLLHSLFHSSVRHIFNDVISLLRLLPVVEESEAL